MNYFQLVIAITDDKEIESRTLDVHIGLLRQKLNNQKLIETVRGVGYRIL